LWAIYSGGRLNPEAEYLCKNATLKNGLHNFNGEVLINKEEEV
jgi:hypothetical protein